MKKYLTILLVSLISTLSHAYYGIHSTEAILKFSSKIELELPTNAQKLTLAQLNKNTSLKKKYLEVIDYQLQHLLGAFTSESFMEKTNGATATISNDYQITLTSLKPSNTGQNLIILTYNFSGKVLVHRDFFGEGGQAKTGKLPITLPLNPLTIYQLGVRQIKVPVDEHHPNGERELAWFNLCTDVHYNSDGDFFYFWDPDRINRSGREWRYPNCPLREDNVNVLRLTGSIKRLPNSYQKYFEYDRLYSKKKLKISLFLGYLSDVEDFETPNMDDYIWDGLKEIDKRIKAEGFTVTGRYDHYAFDEGTLIEGGINTYIKYLKTGITRDIVRAGEKNPTMDVEIEILLSDTSIGSEDGAFHHFYRHALKNSDIIIYDGHSGLGANLDLDSIDAKLANSSKYQIVYLNGCSGYPYFKDMYFDAKAGGTKNLDLILSGIATLSDTVAGNMMAFMEGFMSGKTLNTSYILQKIEAANFDANGSYLTGVMGEQDNIWKKPKE